MCGEYQARTKGQRRLGLRPTPDEGVRGYTILSCSLAGGNNGVMTVVALDGECHISRFSRFGGNSSATPRPEACTLDFD